MFFVLRIGGQNMILRIALLLVAVASLIAFPKSSSAGLVTFTDQASFNIAIASLSQSAFVNFDSTAPGDMTSSFLVGGIGFHGTTENSPGAPGAPVALPLSVNAGTTASGPNYLGTGGDDFNGASSSIGDMVTISIPSTSRAIGLNIITDTPPDILSFGRLAAGGANVDISSGIGTALSGNFKSYFVGIVGQFPADIFSTASVGFTGGGSFFRIDNVGVYAVAVPEPSSMMLVAVIGLVGIARRRARRA